MIKLLDRYILKRFLSTFIFVVLILLSVITVIDLTEKTDKYAKANLSFWEILQYYGDFIPWVGGLITPITVFIATVYVCSRMAAHTEVIAILSSGVSFRRMMLPYLVGAALIAGTSFVLNGWVIPNSNKSRLEFELLYLRKSSSYSHHNIHMQVARNTFMYLQSYNTVSNSGYHFSLERFENNKLIEKLTARRIEWDTTVNKWRLKNWELKKINRVFEPDASDTASMLAKGESMDTTLSIHPKEFENDYRKYDGLTLNELDSYIKTLRARGASGIEAYEVEKYTRYASPFSIFILTFMGVIVSSRKSRGGTGFQIALGFLLSFIFILFFMMFRTFAEAGALPPQISVWIPATIFGILSLIMYKYVPR